MGFANFLSALVSNIVSGRSGASGLQYQVRAFLGDMAGKAAGRAVERRAERQALEPASPPPPPPARASGAPAALSSEDEAAWVLIRAMIAAAAADGEIDADERDKILTTARQADLSAAEMTQVEHELLRPQSPEQIAAMARDRDHAAQIYRFSLQAIVVDTEVERLHMKRLARALDLGTGTLARIHEELGVSGLD